MNRESLELLKGRPDLWDHFIRKEEFNSEFRDQYDRFPYYLSKTRDIFQPDVSRFLIDSGYKPEYPDGKKFAVCLTHDIDFVYQSVSRRGYHIAHSLYKKDKNTFSRSIKDAFNKKNPLCNFEKIMDLEEKYGAKSSFYFLALKPGDQDYSYDIMDLKDDIKNIRVRGWEVGLHGGHEAYNSYERICEEKNRLENALGSEIIGYRNHYLHFRVPDTWEYLSHAGFMYDTTFGYGDCVGFRNGMCHPFIPFNPETERPVGIVEIPLIVMDSSLFQAYMRLDTKDAMDVMHHLIDTTAECQGVFTLLWHNTCLVEGSPEQRIYRNILDYCSKKGAWMTSGENVAKWWEINEQIKY